MLGDLVHEALALVGITPLLVSKWVGSCHCEERRQALNAWSRRVLSGRLENAAQYLRSIIGE